jgi:hypothetical protein
MRKAVAIYSILLALARAYAVAQDPHPDPFRNWSTHDIPHCSPTGKGGKSARCGCTGMVHQVHEVIALSCWKDEAGVDKPDEFLLDNPPKPVLTCMEARHKDHCQIVSLFPSTIEEMYGVKVNPRLTCRTSCKPERCGCADSACKMHGQGGGY